MKKGDKVHIKGTTDWGVINWVDNDEIFVGLFGDKATSQVFEKSELKLEKAKRKMFIFIHQFENLTERIPASDKKEAFHKLKKTSTHWADFDLIKVSSL